MEPSQARAAMRQQWRIVQAFVLVAAECECILAVPAARTLLAEPPQARGAGDLGPAQAASPALLFPSVCRHSTSGRAWKLLTKFVTRTVFYFVCLGESRAHIVLLPHNRLGWHAPMAAARFVCEPL
jgi:hypothetical protein